MTSPLARAPRPVSAFDFAAVPTAQEVLGRVKIDRAALTAAAYDDDLAVFARHLGLDSGLDAVRLLLGVSGPQGNRLVFGWLDAMSHLAPATRARRLATVRRIVSEAQRMGYVGWSVYARPPKVHRLRGVQGPPADDIRRMLEACGDGPAGLRDRLIVQLLAVLGLRRIEVARLQLANYDRAHRRLHVTGKGGRRDLLTLPAPLARLLDEWILAANITEPHAPLVHSFTRPRKPINLHGLDYIVRRLGRRVGIRVWPHALRHSAITLGLQHGHELRVVQRFSRHADPKTVIAYDDDARDLGAQVSETLADLLTSPSDAP